MNTKTGTQQYFTDARLIQCEYWGRTGSGPATNPLWTAIYQDGTHLIFSVEHSRAARVCAQEYGMRMLEGTKLSSIRMVRP